ncbi:tetratricopeptide repeat protein [Streptomyces sp. QL37]|uniref:tetratricopeptide repeat protein n=1 Tax=Streptomyces sp. QL37 TaxID=2093747 RepID=UPI000CF1CEFD|nr:tetratricopeptide repeat protein [Streptomyces sp. QL37]PPQ61177.1 hypothetical protein C5F59_34250 [Streptomyces sp. QL37]
MEQREVPGDAVMTRIGQAIMLLHAGDREEARNRFGIIWSEIGERGAALHRCTLAHYMADTQDDPGDELAWDLRALTAAEGVTGAGGADPGAAPDTSRGAGHGAGADPEPGGERREVTAVRALVPSLHLNLAADYLKLQRFESARVHLDRAWDAVGVLEDDGYGGGIRAAIGRMEQRMRGSAAGG